MSQYRPIDVLVLGGGNAGISTAARLRRKGIDSVAVVEPQSVHTYRPLLSYVGAGQANQRRAERTQRSVTPAGCTWIKDAAVAVDAAQSTVTCAAGSRIRYRDLVVGTGLVPDTRALPGIDAALQTSAVTSNYLDYAEKTWKLVRDLPAGSRAVFTVPRPPVSCTGTTIKPVLLAAAHWRRMYRLERIEVTLVVDRPRLLIAPELDSELSKQLRQYGVRILYNTRIQALEPGNQSIRIIDGDATEDLAYDLLHLVPPFCGPQWLSESGLSAPESFGLVDVDPMTMRHRAHPNIWGVGDGAALDTDSSGGALRRQVKIAVDNLLAARRGGHLTEYDGYTVSPVATSRHRLIAGEFDRTGAIAASLPEFIDPTKARTSAWAFDRFVLPQIYWHLILRGRV